MNILMVTNTYTPHVSGVARSVEGFAGEFRRLGHRVLVVAPIFADAPAAETDTVRLPAVQHFNGSDFSLPVPIPGKLSSALRDFAPEIVHSHHPFLLGDTALRIAAGRQLPVVFTHHTMYEHYTHYVPGDSPLLRRFVADLVTGYCNLCNVVIAPGRWVAELLRRRGVKVPVEIIPTGVDLGVFAGGDGAACRARAGIPPGSFVIGHVGRLAPEKNPAFLAEAVVRYLQRNPRACFLLAGGGPAAELLRAAFSRRGLADRFHFLGVLDRAALAEAYAAMDVFAFASQTETQGMVLTEAMAAGVPVVAVDAPGVQDVLRDGDNGRLLPREEPEAFAAALAWIATLPPAGRERLRAGVARTAAEFSLPATAARLLGLYTSLVGLAPSPPALATSPWSIARRRFGEEWKILRNITHAAGDAVLSLPETEATGPAVGGFPP